MEGFGPKGDKLFLTLSPGFDRLPKNHQSSLRGVDGGSDSSTVTLNKRKLEMQEFDQLKEMITSAEDDVQKAEGGNKAAGTRVRKSMQDIKNAAQLVRTKILEKRSQ